jgi:hypothetical protein
MQFVVTAREPVSKKINPTAAKLEKGNAPTRQTVQV